MQSRVYLLGVENLFRELLASHILEGIGLDCEIVRNVNLIPPNPSERKCLIMIDGDDDQVEQLLLDLRYQKRMDAGSTVVAMYNIDTVEDMEREAIERGVKGLFYKSDRLDLIDRGVKALLEGQVWLPRRVLVKIAMEPRRSERAAKGVSDARLTKRELEVLAYVGVGCTNDEIAQKLFISPHTVKTHLYRVYRKIGVQNRFQASLWAATNM